MSRVSGFLWGVYVWYPQDKLYLLTFLHVFIYLPVSGGDVERMFLCRPGWLQTRTNHLVLLSWELDYRCVPPHLLLVLVFIEDLVPSGQWPFCSTLYALFLGQSRYSVSNRWCYRKLCSLWNTFRPTTCRYYRGFQKVKIKLCWLWLNEKKAEPVHRIIDIDWLYPYRKVLSCMCVWIHMHKSTERGLERYLPNSG